MKKPKILIIYTGGTIGMINDVDSGMLKPCDFNQITTEVPELKKLDCSLDAVSFKKPIDSSNMNPVLWKKLGDYIYKCNLNNTYNFSNDSQFHKLIDKIKEIENFLNNKENNN